MSTLVDLNRLLNSADLIVCDFGGVLYHIDFERTRAALKALPGYNGAQIDFGVDKQDELFVRYDKGDISTHDFYHALRAKFGFVADDAAMNAAWCALLIESYDFAREAALAFKSVAPTVMLSNINSAHIGKILPECTHFLPEFAALYFSCRMHKRKPDAEAFQYVCEQNGVNPERAVLIDDSQANCDAAAWMGMQTVRITGPELLREFVSTRFASVS